MADTIKWLFEMIDKVSGPSKNASRSLGDFIQTTHSALASIQLIGQAAAGAGRLISAGLEPAISREKSLGAFETLLGSAEKARDMYGQAVKFAAETPFETAQVVDSFQRLLTARFDQAEVPIAMRIIGDAASMQEDSQQAVASVTRALSQIRSKGRLQGEELMQLQEAVPLNTAALYERLGKIYGTNAQAARKMQEAGQIDSQVASFAILAQLQSQFGGNMERSSKQIGGLLSTLRSRPSELLSQLQDTKGYTALSGALSTIVERFGEASPAGQGLRDMVNDLGGGALERVAVLLDYVSAGAGSFIEGLRAGLGPLGDAFGPTNQTNLETFRVLMEGVGTGVGKLASGISSVVSNLKMTWGYLTDIGKWWSQNETMAGFLDRWVSPLVNAEQTTGSGTGTTQAELVARARLVKRLPSDSGGIAATDIPEFGEGGIVTRRTLAFVGESGPEAIVPLGRGGVQASISSLPAAGASIQFSMPVTITGMSESGAATVGQTFLSQVEPALLGILERWALQSGRLAR